MAKARNRDKCVPIQDCESLSSNKDETGENIEVVRSIIAELPVSMKEVVFLRYYNKISYQQIADILGISQEAVNGRLRRAKKIIARELRCRASVEIEI
ncbi:MAG: RNA polymerase sigma factor [Planctomycetota bacterium]|jgi:RNA polymerase sigma-70 factor (ECF subfamily)